MFKKSVWIGQLSRQKYRDISAAIASIDARFTRCVKSGVVAFALLGASSMPLLWSLSAKADVVSDNTTGTLVNQGQLSVPFPASGDIVTGGEVRDTNLFHSFSTFSPGLNATEFRVFDPNITNIFSRVTGLSSSSALNTTDINGLLQVVGGNSPNLFLLNPNGILVGPQAAINVPGSLFLSTADRISFDAAGQVFFSASDTANSLLSVSTPVGLQFGAIANPIEVNGRLTTRGNDGEYNPAEFYRFPANASLTLLGGDVTVNDAYFQMPNGRINIGSVEANSSVGLTADTNVYPSPFPPGFATATTHTLEYSENTAFKDILFDNVILDVDGVGSGDIQLQGRRITLSNSALRSDNSGPENGGLIEILGSEQITIEKGSRISADLDAIPLPDGTLLPSDGNGGDIVITAPSITISKSFLSTVTASAGDGGGITLNGDRSVDLSSSTVISSVRAEDVGLTLDEVEQTLAEINIPVMLVRTLGTIEQITRRPGGILSATIGLLGALELPEAEAADVRVQLQPILNRTELTQSGVAIAIGEISNVLDTTSMATEQKTRALGILSFELSNLQFRQQEILPLIASAGLTPEQSQVVVPAIAAKTQFPATGQGGNLVINAGQLTIGDLTQIGTGTFSEGNSGDLTINATVGVDISGSELTELPGAAPSYISSGIFISAERGSTGNGGNLSVRAPQLTISDGAKLGAGTSGQGDAGNIFIEVGELSVSDPVVDFVGDVSGIVATVLSTGSGNAGQLEIMSDRIHLFNGGQIAASTQGAGNAGNIRIQSGVIEVEGRSADGLFESSISSRSSTPFDAGSVELTANRINIKDEGNISVSSANGGNAGNLSLSAGTVYLNNGSIQAEADAGDQGNLNITATDVLLLREGSNITTDATATATGGNITLNSPLIVGTGNSDISANAVEGNGGNIRLITEGLIGLEFRDQLTPENDITASSELGVNGTVEIESPNVDTDSGLVQLPENLADASNQVASSCAADDGNRFASTGRGGLPTNPLQYLSSNRPWQDARAIALPPTAVTRQEQSDDGLTTSSVPSEVSETTLEEASAWAVDTTGQVVLHSASAIASKDNTCLNNT